MIVTIVRGVEAEKVWRDLQMINDRAALEEIWREVIASMSRSERSRVSAFLSEVADTDLAKYFDVQAA